MNWILDADICGFFDAIDHGWLMKVVEHRTLHPVVSKNTNELKTRAGVIRKKENRPEASKLGRSKSSNRHWIDLLRSTGTFVIRCC